MFCDIHIGEDLQPGDYRAMFRDTHWTPERNQPPIDPCAHADVSRARLQVKVARPRINRCNQAFVQRPRGVGAFVPRSRASLPRVNESLFLRFAPRDERLRQFMQLAIANCSKSESEMQTHSV
jgi:hypothetical protein